MPANALTVRGQELGEQLRVLRAESGMNLQSAARRIDMSPSQLSRLENGQRRAPVEVVTALLATYGVTGQRRRTALALAREHDEHGWWQRDRPDLPSRQDTLAALESRADRIVNYEGVVIPGLLQTGEYTRALLTEPGMEPRSSLEQCMLTRLRRQSVLLRRNSPDFVAIIDEFALRRFVGGQDVLRRQLEYLLEAACRPNVEIRVLVNSGAHAGLRGPFCMVRQRSGQAVVMLENLTCSLFVEDPDDVVRYELAARKLLTRALDTPESTKLIATLAMEMDAEADCAWT
ncbi:helix-turn-helix transcriptional regulator [Saccharopolyspora sp. NFXS83]|uniref:helix-turn-helix domain-containing protein n=1 Tax=Saccharopolyspora sp. NFXS83 TaxID=2993560 RepID=UPI00224B9210|nr:helix-turn-helix transcriptional regulator [Saccharopolyspora sp. NFXS83]MCX2732639.1 helix-turn-helix transcriptional regulator [Saccharopolyspora sp. NFXS83]